MNLVSSIRFFITTTACLAALLPNLIWAEDPNLQRPSELEEHLEPPSNSKPEIGSTSSTTQRSLAVYQQFEVTKPAGLTGQILFTVSISGNDQISVLDLDSDRVRPVIDGPGRNSYPAWSPDGTKFVFVSDRTGNKEIFSADWDGQNQKQLTKRGYPSDNPTWSPDGTKILFYSTTRTGKDEQYNLFTMNVDGSSPSQITNFPGRNVTPRWSPDSLKLAYSTNRFWPGWDLCVLTLSKNIETCPLSGKISYCRPAWSKSSSKLLYAFGHEDEIDLGILDLSNNEETTLTTMKGREYDPIWSPDESYVAFVSEEQKRDLFNLTLYSFSNKETALLLKAPYSMRYPSWTARTTLELEVKRLKDNEANQGNSSTSSTAPSLEPS